MKLPATGFQQIAPIEETGQYIADGLISQLVTQLDVGDSQTDVFDGSQAYAALIGKSGRVVAAALGLMLQMQ